MADVLKIDRECPNCHKITVLAVTGQGFKAWDMGRGAFVQDAFPELDDSQRETLITGLCADCSDELFADLDTLDECDTGPTPGAQSEGSADSPVANPGAPGVTATPAECASRALLGLTAEGEPATRGHLHAPSADWPRCSTEIPGLDSPVFITQANICNRPATLLMGFSADYLHSMRSHRCGERDCPIEELGGNEQALAELHTKHVPLCAMHLPTLRSAEQQWLKEVGRAEGVAHAFELVVIGVESISLLGGGRHPEAQVIDLRPLTGVQFP